MAGPSVVPGPRIGPGHDGSHVVAAGIQAVDGLPFRVEHACIDVGGEPGADGDVRRPDGDRVEWRRCKRADAGIGLVARVAVEAVELGLAFAEVDVHPGHCELVLARDGVAQRRGRHTDLSGQSSRCVGPVNR